MYAQVTSPLRRYLDLVAHQQLRAHALGQTVLDEEQMIERIGATDVVSPLLRKTERFSRQHWTLVWLKANKDWRGDGILMAMQNRNAQFQLPDIGLEIRIPMKQEMQLDQVLPVELTGVDLAQLETHFRLVK
jgi:exoribonuclease-2